MKFGSILKEKRLEKKLTQQELADLLFVTRTTISKWENGIRYPDYDTLGELSKILKVSANELLCQNEINNLTISVSNNQKKKSHFPTLIISLINCAMFIATLWIFLPSYFSGKDNDIREFDQYYSLSTFKGIEIYCWQNENKWFSGAMSGTNRNKTSMEILSLSPASLSKMRSIIESYDFSGEEQSYIVVFIVWQLSSQECDYELVENYSLELAIYLKTKLGLE